MTPHCAWLVDSTFCHDRASLLVVSTNGVSSAVAARLASMTVRLERRHGWRSSQGTVSSPWLRLACAKAVRHRLSCAQIPVGGVGFGTRRRCHHDKAFQRARSCWYCMLRYAASAGLARGCATEASVTFVVSGGRGISRIISCRNLFAYGCSGISVNTASTSRSASAYCPAAHRLAA